MPHGGLCPPPVLPAASAHFLQDKAPPSKLLFFFFLVSLGFGGHLWSCPHSQRFGPWGQQAAWGWQAKSWPRPRGPWPRDPPPCILPAAQESAKPRNLLGDAPGRKRLGTQRPPTRAGLRVRRSEAPSATPPAVVKLGREGGGLSAYTSPWARGRVKPSEQTTLGSAGSHAGALPGSVVPSLPLPGHRGLRCRTPGLPAAAHGVAGPHGPIGGPTLRTRRPSLCLQLSPSGPGTRLRRPFRARVRRFRSEKWGLSTRV